MTTPDVLRYRLRNKAMHAEGIRIEDGFKVLRGSQARIQTKTIQSRQYKAKRQSLIDEGKLRPLPDQPELYELTEDVKFVNASEAATVLHGRQSNGAHEWLPVGDGPSPRVKTPYSFKARRKSLASDLVKIAGRCEKLSGLEAEIWRDKFQELATRLVAGSGPETVQASIKREDSSLPLTALIKVEPSEEITQSSELNKVLQDILSKIPNAASADHSPREAFDLAIQQSAKAIRQILG